MRIALALKIAKILAAQGSAQSYKDNCGASAIASKIVGPQACAAIIAVQVPTFVYRRAYKKVFIGCELVR